MKRKSQDKNESQRSTAERHHQPAENATTDRGHPIGTLHRQVGNQAVRALYEHGNLQAKLEVSSPRDPAEREAERVADEVMRAGKPKEESASDVSEVLRSTSGSTGGGVLTEDAESQVRSSLGSGKPLPESTRSTFESRFGQDFSDVRVHTGPDADEAAQSINAEAFTLGTDVAFAEGNYDPGSGDGRKLLAHELTHVVQQGGEWSNAQRSIHRQQATERTTFLDDDVVDQPIESTSEIGDFSTTSRVGISQGFSGLRLWKPHPSWFFGMYNGGDIGEWVDELYDGIRHTRLVSQELKGKVRNILQFNEGVAETQLQAIDERSGEISEILDDEFEQTHEGGNQNFMDLLEEYETKHSNLRSAVHEYSSAESEVLAKSSALSIAVLDLEIHEAEEDVAEAEADVDEVESEKEKVKGMVSSAIGIVSDIAQGKAKDVAISGVESIAESAANATVDAAFAEKLAEVEQRLREAETHLDQLTVDRLHEGIEEQSHELDSAIDAFRAARNRIESAESEVESVENRLIRHFNENNMPELSGIMMSRGHYQGMTAETLAMLPLYEERLEGVREDSAWLKNRYRDAIPIIEDEINGLPEDVKYTALENARNSETQCRQLQQWATEEKTTTIPRIERLVKGAPDESETFESHFREVEQRLGDMTDI